MGAIKLGGIFCSLYDAIQINIAVSILRPPKEKSYTISPGLGLTQRTWGWKGPEQLIVCFVISLATVVGSTARSQRRSPYINIMSML